MASTSCSFSLILHDVWLLNPSPTHLHFQNLRTSLKRCSFCKTLPTPQCHLQGSFSSLALSETPTDSPLKGSSFLGEGIGLLCRDLSYNLSSPSYRVYSLLQGQKPFPGSILLTVPTTAFPSLNFLPSWGLFTISSEVKWDLCKCYEWGERQKRGDHHTRLEGPAGTDVPANHSHLLRTSQPPAIPTLEP